MTQLYLASTPLNILCSVLIAKQSPNLKHHLRLIDQPGNGEPFISSLKRWADSPFESVEVLSNKVKGLKKLSSRKKNFAKIRQLINELKPSNIFTGNDRRIEFQYSMHISKAIKLAAVGHYMDDGTYSYIGKPSHWLKDKVFDNIIKKVTYGFWWHQPETVGASSLISVAHLAFPVWAVKQIKNKTIKQLPNICSDSGFEDWLELLDREFAFSQLKSVNEIWLLPHQSLIEKRPGYKSRLRQEIAQSLANGKTVAVKNHPRNLNVSELMGMNMDVIELPAKIPFELLLSNVLGAEIKGDFTTSLLFARWLQPESKVFARISIDDKLATKLTPMMEDLGITLEVN